MKKKQFRIQRIIQEFHLLIPVLKKLLGNQGYILLVCILVGVISGLSAVLLKNFAHLWRDYLYSLAGKLPQPWVVWILPLLPAVGIFLCIIIVRLFFNARPYEKSLAGVILSTTNGTSDLPRGKMFSHIITSGLAVGAGASAGLEAPIALTGSAIGSNMAKFCHLGRETRTLLLACGGGAGISAIFSSPVTGALFACEILLPSFSVPALIPLLMASASAAVVAELCHLSSPFIQLNTGWTVLNVPYYIFIGIAAGLISAMMIRISVKMAEIAGKHTNCWLRGLYGCAILYIIFLLLPALKGEGYGFISDLIRGDVAKITDNGILANLFSGQWMLILLVGILFLVKPFVSALSVESGGDGGIFGPSLFVGAFLGYFISRFLNLTGITVIDPVNCIAVGMGGVLAGVMHAPLTGMFLIAELTGGYRLFVPLMIVVALSSFISKRLVRHNVYKSMIVLKGQEPEKRDDEVILTGAKLNDLVETDYMELHENDTLRSIVRLIMASRKDVFPVLDDHGVLTGLIRVSDLRQFMLNTELYDMVVAYDIMSDTGPILDAGDTLSDAAHLFDSLHTGHLPVTRDGKYIGFISKSGLYDDYRRILREKHDLF